MQDVCAGAPKVKSFKLYAFVAEPGDGESNVGGQLGEWTTDSGGDADIDAPAGRYVLGNWTEEYGEILELIDFECNKTTIVNWLGDAVVAFDLYGCIDRAGGCRVEVRGPGGLGVVGSFITRSDGPTYFTPRWFGGYTFEAHHPSGRFNPLSGSFTVDYSCTYDSPIGLNEPSSFEPTAGYSCCLALKDAFGKRTVPVGPLKATTSAGQTFDLTCTPPANPDANSTTGWLDARCAKSDEVPFGGAIVRKFASTMCPYDDFPPDIAMGRATVDIKIQDPISQGTPEALQSVIAYTHPAWLVQFVDPAVPDHCNRKWLPWAADDPATQGKFWHYWAEEWTGGGCTGSRNSYGGDALPEILSEYPSPLSLKFTFADPAGAAWAWTSPAPGDRNPPAAPRDLRWIKIDEQPPPAPAAPAAVPPRTPAFAPATTPDVASTRIDYGRLLSEVRACGDAGASTCGCNATRHCRRLDREVALSECLKCVAASLGIPISNRP